MSTRPGFARCFERGRHSHSDTPRESKRSFFINRKTPAGPRKRRKTAAASESADSILSRAAHFTPLQRSLLEARRALTSRRPDDENALANGNRAHETLAREFAADLWRQDGLKPNQSESQPSQEILKHYYTKIANWLKRRPKATDDD